MGLSDAEAEKEANYQVDYTMQHNPGIPVECLTVGLARSCLKRGYDLGLNAQRDQKLDAEIDREEYRQRLYEVAKGLLFHGEGGDTYAQIWKFAADFLAAEPK